MGFRAWVPATPVGLYRPRANGARRKATATLALMVTATTFALPISPRHALAQSPIQQAPGPKEAPQSLKWADLLPPAPPGPPKGLKSFLANRPPPGAAMDHNPQVSEGRWLSPGAMPTQRSEPPAVVQALDGKRVKLGGYVVPLDFDATSVKEFLLVPFVGACIHVPPPPPNQLVYVKSETGFDVKGLFDPVWVTGRMQTKVAFTGLAEAGYSLDAETVEHRPE